MAPGSNGPASEPNSWPAWMVISRTDGRDRLPVGSVVYAKGFYEANGYEVLRKDTAWDGSDFFRMVKRL